MHLTKYEKETIILWNQTNKPASIQTYNPKLKRRLAEFAKSHPDLCKLEQRNDMGGDFYRLEKSRLSLRLIAPYSKERKETASKYAKTTLLVKC